MFYQSEVQLFSSLGGVRGLRGSEGPGGLRVSYLIVNSLLGI